MSTCKDCIHHKICEGFYEDEGTPLMASLCKEGDNTIMLLAVGGRGYIFGKEAFLTAEEAEQALRR